MQTPSASDPSFKAFLEKLQEQNNRGFASQLVQLKAERENAGEDNDKREKQLDDVITSLKDVRSAVTGIKIDIDLTPLVNIGENQTKLLEELIKESSLTRKLTEGSVEYDKEASQYRNTSGRDIESKVSGKTSKDGGFIDFETARDTLSGQGKRAKEANTFDLKPISYTPGKAAAAAVGGKGKKPADEEEDLNQPAFKGFLEEIKSGFKFFMTDGLSEKPGTGIFQKPSKEVEKKDKETDVSSPIQQNPEADNIATTGEIEADAAKNDLELSKQMLDTTKAQLVELKAIREALAPKTPKDLRKEKSIPILEKEGGSGGPGGGGLLSMLGDLIPGMGMGGLGKGLMTAGKAVLPYALPAAAMIGTGAAYDYGLGKLGVGKDKEGNDLQIDKKQDDANWAKMSMGQKIQSGVGRGIEKVGSALFLDNMSREAQADRVKNETEYFKDKDFVDSSKEQDEANYKKMSFGKKILSSINRGGEKLSLFDSTKTTAARIRKETEELNKDAPGAATKEALAPASVTTTKAASDPAPGTATKAALAPAPELTGSKADKARLAAKEQYQLGTKEEEATKQKLKEFEKANPFDFREKPTSTQAFLDMPGTGKFSDPKKQKEYDALMDATYKASDKKEKAYEDYEKTDEAQKYKVNKRGDQSENIGATFNKKDALTTRFGYKDTDLLNKDGQSYSISKINEAYEAKVKEDLLSPLSGKVPSAAATPVVNKKPVDTAAPGKAAGAAMGAAAPVVVKKEAGPNWKATLQDYKSSTPVDGLESQYPGIKAKFIELANNSTPRTDNRQSIETHEDILKTKALRELTGGKNTESAKPGSVSPTDTTAGPKPGESTALKANSVAQGIGAAISPEASTASLGERVKSEATRLGIEPGKGKGVFEGGVLTKMVDTNTGKEHDIEVSEKDKSKVAAAREMRAMNENSGRLAAAASRNLGSDVNRTSTENADMGRESGRGGSNNTVVSNNVSSNNTTKIVPMKANPRPEYTGSSLDRYTNRITVY